MFEKTLQNSFSRFKLNLFKQPEGLLLDGFQHRFLGIQQSDVPQRDLVVLLFQIKSAEQRDEVLTLLKFFVG
jgi:hypothetical protein